MAGIAAQYRIGPSDFFTSGDLEEDARTLSGQLEVLDGLSWEATTQDLFDSWNQFLAGWRGWYNRTFRDAWTGAGWNDGNRDELIQYERRFLQFVEQWSAQSGQPFPGGVVAPSTGTQDTFGDHLSNQLKNATGLSTIALVLIVVAAAVIFYEFRA